MTKLDIIKDGYSKYPEQFVKMLFKDCVDINAIKRVNYINKLFIENGFTPIKIKPKGVKIAAEAYAESNSKSDSKEAFIKGVEWALSQGFFLPGTIYKWDNGEYDVQTDLLLPPEIEVSDKEAVMIHIIKL